MPKVAVTHQPNFLPWLGFFYKMTYADVFVVLDEVQFLKRSYISRCRVPVNGTPTWLTVPVKTPSSRPPINEVHLAETHFVRKHLNSLRHTYSKCKCFDEVFAFVEGLYETAEEGERLDVFNMRLIEAIAAYLDLEPTFVRLSSLQATGHKNELLAEAVRAAGCDVYVAGGGGASYMSGHEDVYHGRGVRVAYQIFDPPAYEQQSTDQFVPGCSIIDLLFNHGPDSRRFLAPQADPPWREWTL